MADDRVRDAWGHPVPGRCPRCGSLNLEPSGEPRGHGTPPTWRCRNCGERATLEEIADAPPEATAAPPVEVGEATDR